MAVESAQSRGIILFYNMKCTQYRFASLANNINTISDTSTDGSIFLSYVIGETLSAMIRNKNVPLELIRLNKESETIIARRRFNDIKLEIYRKGVTS